MIVVSNTKELERKYNLSKLRDNERIIVQGGIAGKSKYNGIARYELRTTYTVRQIKQIIGQMKLIESSIPREWSELQRAKYIYEVLGKRIEYNYNKAEYSSQQSSNLTILLSGKGICAGYSLLYKEMMDRQGIKCDYIRGKGKKEMHAWNVLTINGKSFPVDLTWDSNRMRKGSQQLQFFGVDRNFTLDHTPDADERKYRYTLYSHEFVNSINTNPNQNKKQNEKSKDIKQEQKRDIIELAIEETYQKFKETSGVEAATKQVKGAIRKYIQENNACSFTRNGNARKQLQAYVLPDDMLNLLAESYVEQAFLKNNHNSALIYSIVADANAYNREHAVRALVKYIQTGRRDYFTKSNGARQNLREHVSQKDALETMINTMTEQYIKSIERADKEKTYIIGEAQKGYFYGDEFANINLPTEKRKGIIEKAIQWIKTKIREKQNRRESQKAKQQIRNDQKNYSNER